MDAETSAMYAVFAAERSPQERALIDAALSTDPAEIAVTFIVTDDAAGHEPVAHTALRPVRRGDHPDALEVKKVFVVPERRGHGLARVLLAESERFAREAGKSALVLQTGRLQVAAIRLYEDLGYEPVPAYGDYGVIPATLTFRKELAD
jgi:GNAT superfamily N-acetyltransferase